MINLTEERAKVEDSPRIRIFINIIKIFNNRKRLDRNNSTIK